uniref:protein acetyllysine N-acetyltransferase n=1 Tax=Romanomermis culicivorax TaxID=13658 RepID=A0A915IBG3_ROMCU
MVDIHRPLSSITGPNGVWTLERDGKTPNFGVTFDDATPTYTHMALVTLEKLNILKYLVTQNVDGLHMRSGFPRDRMSELHGNVFIEQCDGCGTEVIHDNAISSVGQKPTGLKCSAKKPSGRFCHGHFIDTVLDWEAPLPEKQLKLAEGHSSIADLSICLGSTLQIVPAGTLPLLTRRNGGRMVIVNLQETKQDKQADLIIHARVDDVMSLLMNKLQLDCIPFSGHFVVPTSSNVAVDAYRNSIENVTSKSPSARKRSIKRPGRKTVLRLKSTVEKSDVKNNSSPSKRGRGRPAKFTKFLAQKEEQSKLFPSFSLDSCNGLITFEYNEDNRRCENENDKLNYHNDHDNETIRFKRCKTEEKVGNGVVVWEADDEVPL